MERRLGARQQGGPIGVAYQVGAGRGLNRCEARSFQGLPVLTHAAQERHRDAQSRLDTARLPRAPRHLAERPDTLGC
jgi:hypothetical protein